MGSIRNFRIDKSINTYKSYASGFGFEVHEGERKLGQSCNLTIIMQLENIEMSFIPKVRMGAC